MLRSVTAGHDLTALMGQDHGLAGAEGGDMRILVSRWMAGAAAGAILACGSATLAQPAAGHTVPPQTPAELIGSSVGSPPPAPATPLLEGDSAAGDDPKSDGLRRIFAARSGSGART